MSPASFLYSGKNKYLYFWAFIIPVTIVTIILIAGGVYPLGEECFLRTDMYHQYAPFMSEFRHKLSEGGSLLYSWNVGMGVNFVALYAYYLASPLNWLVILCPESYVIEFIMLMVVIKFGLCGVSMAYYLRAHSRYADKGILMFAVFYALSGYMCAYYWDIMWLDCIVLFPLIMLGLERLFDEGSGVLYTLALGISILSNYYISIMTCMFLCVYFAALFVLRGVSGRREILTRIGRFAFYSLLSGGLAAVLLLPEIAAMSYTASADINFPENFNEYFSIIDMLARHLPGVETEQALDHWPNIYCGTAVLFLFPLYLMNRRIRGREKAVYTVLIIFMLMGFSINVLNFIWHGFHYPNSLPARQSYIYVFLILVCCFRVYVKRRYVRRRELLTAFSIAFAFVLLCQHSASSEQGISFISYYAALILISLYVGIFHAFMKHGISKRTAGFLALCLVCIEASGNTAVTGMTTTSRESYVKDNEDIRLLTESLFPSSEFFRVEREGRKTRNDGAWLNFPSVSLFSSLANADCTDFFRAVGCEGSTNAYGINGSTPLIDMLLSVRYDIYNAPQEDGEGKHFIESHGDSYLYEYNYVLPLGYVLLSGMDEDWIMELGNPIMVQNSICDMLGVPQVLVQNGMPGNTDGESYAVTITEDGEYYALIKNQGVRDATVLWPDRKKTFNNTDRGYLLELGDCSRGDSISITSETRGQDMEAEVYRFDYDALKKVYEKLSPGSMHTDIWEDDRIRGSVTITQDMLSMGEKEGRLFLGIPYDEGWSVTVDGRPVETEKAFGAFLCISVPLGEHVIELRYMPKGLVPGAMISVSSLLILLLAVYRKRWQKSRAEQILLQSTEDEKEEAEVFTEI